MPTILELFIGSANDITPRVVDQYIVEEIFQASPLSKAVKPDKDTIFEFETTGIRLRSAVELNNPLLYGNQAIRIATRSTSAVELMKQGTGGEAGDGGLIGQALGEITGGGFGRFVFGGQVSSLNQARDGINSRLGIPSLTIPTFVNNTGELQKGIEPNTMITIAKIRNDAAGTEFGKFLKQTGGGTPRTIGRQALGQGITLVKDKVRDILFGNPDALGSNAATPANGGYEYSSLLPYSRQLLTRALQQNQVKPILNRPDPGQIQTALNFHNLKLDSFQRLDDLASKPKQNVLTTDQNLVLVNRETAGISSQEELDDLLATKDRLKRKHTINADGIIEYKTTENSGDYKSRDVREDLTPIATTPRPNPFQTELDSKFAQLKEEEKTKIGDSKPKPHTFEPYSGRLGNYKLDFEEAGTAIVDLSLVSPVYGVNRLSTNGRYGKTEYGFSDVRNNTGIYSPYNPTEGANYTAKNKSSWENTYGLNIGNGGDSISKSPIQVRSDAETKILEDQDLIPFWIKSQRSSRSAHFRSYVTSISETSSPSWTTNKFFGNPFNFYTYDGIERGVSLTLSIICLNVDELASNWEKMEFVTQQTYPTFSDSPGSKTFAIPPIVSFRLGDIYNNKISFIDSLSYTVPETSQWETNVSGLLLPKYIDVNISFKFIEQAGSTSVIYNIKRTKDAIQLINEKNSEGGSFTTNSITNTEPSTPTTLPTPSGPSTPTSTPTAVETSTSTPAATTTTPTKVNEYGVPVTTSNESGVNKTPTTLETGEKSTTPYQDKSGEVSTPAGATSYAELKRKYEKEYISQGYPDWLASVLGSNRAEGTKISSITKIDETTYYMEKEYYFEDFVREQVHYKKGNSVGLVRYEKWVSDNNGKDPMNKYFTKQR
jgi:hypothetical protein